MSPQHYDVGNKRFLILRASSVGLPVSRPVSTLVLAAPDQHTLDELECVVAATVRVLTQALQTGESLAHGAWVVPGAGCTEAYLARELRALSQLKEGEGAVLPGASASLRRSVCCAIANYADCLELACGMHAPDTERVSRQWLQALQKGGSKDADRQRLVHYYGWTGSDTFRVMTTRTCEERDPVLMADGDSVLDSLHAKLAALSTACDVANCLLRVDSAIEG